jgi:hypothetical protein
MKIPNTFFIRHCPELAPERKDFLINHHFKDRNLVNKDLRWMEDFNHDHEFVQWLNKYLNLPYGCKLTSHIVKTLEMCRIMIAENLETAISLEDDALFHKDWEKILESIQLPDNILFLNLGTSRFFKVKPELGKVYQISNNGGCEIHLITKKFAELFLKNLNLNSATDIIFHGFLTSIGHPLLCVPIGYETSTLEEHSILDHGSRKDNWVEFVNNYSSNKSNYWELLCEYEKFKIKKKETIEKFEELYGKKVDIKNVEYILSNNENFNNSILDF